MSHGICSINESCHVILSMTHLSVTVAFRREISYTRLLIREPLNKETPPGGGVSFDQYEDVMSHTWIIQVRIILIMCVMTWLIHLWHCARAASNTLAITPRSAGAGAETLVRRDTFGNTHVPAPTKHSCTCATIGRRRCRHISVFAVYW